MRNPIRVALGWYHRLSIRVEITVALIGLAGLIAVALISGFFNLKAARVKEPNKVDQYIDQNIHGGSVKAAGPVNYTINYQAQANQRDIPSTTLRREPTSFKISSLVDDFERSVQDILGRHAKAIEKISGEMNADGQFSGGRHLRVQYEQVRTSKREIEDSWRECERGVKNTLLETGQSEFPVGELKERFQEAERRKERAITKIISMTDEFFMSRKTFRQDQIEAAKKEVFAVEPSL
ncbi:MAG: hypothetical protein HYZ73_06615 [Elusimicrobia bacterium]|nr:hypothetical protein [Elusimicrobiota bacterium]